MNNPLPATNNHLDAAAKAVAQAGNQLHAAATSGAEEISQTAMNEANRIGELARDWLKRNARTALDAAGAVREQAALANDRTQRYVRDEQIGRAHV